MAQECYFKLSIDARKRLLAELFGDDTVKVSTLEIGDVLCEYGEETS